MTENSLTPKEIRESLDVTDATIRNYVRHFGKFLSPDATRKTRKRFSPADVQVLQLAKSYLDDGFTYDQAINLLESQPLDGDILDQENPPGPPQVDKPSSTDAANAIQPQEFYEQFKIALAAKDQTIEILEQDKDRLQRDNAWLRLPWYRKLFRDPPE